MKQFVGFPFENFDFSKEPKTTMNHFKKVGIGRIFVKQDSQKENYSGLI